jgi:hypothetical protein
LDEETEAAQKAKEEEEYQNRKDELYRESYFKVQEFLNFKNTKEITEFGLR